MGEDLKPYPKCGGEVELSRTRDEDVFEYHVDCEACGLITFVTESHVDVDINVQGDLQSIAEKYNCWCLTKPNNYKRDRW